MVLGSIIGKAEILEGRQNTGSPAWLPGFVSVNLFELVGFSLEILLYAYVVGLKGLVVLWTKCLVPRR